MKPASPVILWAVIVRNPRCEWIHYHTLRRTRKESKQAYIESFNEEHRHIPLHEFRKKKIRVALVVVSVKGGAS